MLITDINGDKREVMLNRFIYGERVGNQWRLEFRGWLKHNNEWHIVTQSEYERVMSELERNA